MPISEAGLVDSATSFPSATVETFTDEVLTATKASTVVKNEGIHISKIDNMQRICLSSSLEPIYA